MTPQQTSLDFRPRTLREARATGKEGTERTERHADPAWLEAATVAIRKVCETLPGFISDEIWSVGGLEHSPHDRALGAQIVKAAKTGWCRKTDRMRPSVHSNGSGKPVWVSLLWKGVDV
jgi:hypothetical protein